MRQIRFALLCLSFAGCPAAFAADVPFAGTWASKPEQCGKDQSADGAPLILSETSYNQGEAHCTLEPATQDAGAWKTNAKCMVEGDSQNGTFTFAVDGDTLTVRDDAGERKLQRCPGSNQGATNEGPANPGSANKGEADKGAADPGAADKGAAANDGVAAPN